MPCRKERVLKPHWRARAEGRRNRRHSGQAQREPETLSRESKRHTGYALQTTRRRLSDLGLDFLTSSCRILRWHRLSFSLFENHHLIGAHILKRFVNAARPLHLSAVNFCSVAETEVQTQVVLGHVASAAAHFVHLLLVAGKDRDPRSNAIPIGFLAHRLDQTPNSSSHRGSSAGWASRSYC